MPQAISIFVIKNIFSMYVYKGIKNAEKHLIFFWDMNLTDSNFFPRLSYLNKSIQLASVTSKLKGC